MDLRFTILGQTGVRVEGRLDLRWGPPKLRAMLAALLVRPGLSVSTDELVDWIWGVDDRPPRNPAQTFYLYSSRIRRVLAAFADGTELCVENRNFWLNVDPLSIDYFQFQDQVGRARAHSRRGDHQQALDTLGRAFALWRSPPLADLRSDAAAQWRQRARENVLLPAYDTLFAEQLALGESGAVLAKLDDLALDYRSHLALFKRRLQALHAQARAEDATEQFLIVHKTLSADFDDVGARDLREFHQRLKETGAAPAVTQPISGVLVPNQLPHDVPVFVGHEDLLVKLDTVTTRPRLVVVDGVGGVGKTTFVVHWAHTALGRFPDGVLYVDLQGFSDTPIVEPAAAIDRFLEGLGVSADRIVNPEQRAAKLQSLLNGRQVLVVLDNARDTDHVRPLLPLFSSSVVMVTSRSHLSGLAARQTPYRFPIAPLNPAQSARLLSETIGDPARGHHHVLGDLSRLCGGLPIALKMLAHYIAVRPAVPLGDFVGQLSHELRVLDIGMIGDGANHGPRAVFAQSVRALDPDVHRLFRLLGTHPGPDFGVGVAAALVDLPVRRTRLMLDALVEAHLLEQPGTLGRFKFHDLLREYAAGLIESTGERRAAELRMLDFYLRTAENADKVVFPTQARVRTSAVVTGHDAVDFQDEEAARLWCIGERHNLTAVVRHAVETGYEQQAAQLPQLAGQILLRHGFFDEVVVILHVGLGAAIACSDVEGQADALHNLATTHLLRQEFGLAEHHVHQAHLRYAQIGDETGIAACLHTGARVMVETGNILIGIDSHERALSAIRRTGETGLETVFLYRAGEAYQRAFEYERAAYYYRQSLALARDLDDVASQGRALTLLGSLSFARERTAEARDHLCAALQLLERVYDIGTAGSACGLLARLEFECDRLFEATQYARQAVRLCKRTFDSRGQADALDTLGRILCKAARYEGAVEAWEQAKAIFDDLDTDSAARIVGALREVAAVAVDLPGARQSESHVDDRRMNRQ